MKKSKSVLNPQTFSISQTAKAIRFPGGEIQFFSWLRENGFLISDSTPAQKYLNRGWFLVSKVTLHRLHPPEVVLVSRVTLTGMASLEKIVRKEFPICEPCKEQQSDEK